MDVTLDTIRDIQLYQSKTGYRFSVDALLLFDFVHMKRVEKIADLGAGSGIVGILLAKGYPDAKVTLFELQDNLVKLAEKNVLLNLLEDRIRVVRCDIRTLHNLRLTPRAYDLAVSNPPFRRLKSGRISIEDEKAIARHEIKLRLEELIATASYLLKERGRFYIIYHPHRLSEIMEKLRKRGLEPKRLRFVHSNISSEAKMVLIEAVKGGRVGLKVERPLYIYREDGSYTEEMMKIYKP
ncbi:MAG: tRNA1(Val) (adenine(37)-N6)-methyltransferase [Nitrospira sp.]|nr:tRNA1(Val) (adenine(37)-N6)-methyltransferase [Nitrospira sp.]